MGGVWAYYNFPRYMLMGMPAALLLAVNRVPWPSSVPLRGATVAGVAAASLAFASLGIQAMWELSLQVWTLRHYEQLRPLLH